MKYPPIERAIAALDEEALRTLMLELVPILPSRPRAQWVAALLERAGNAGVEGDLPVHLAPSEQQVQDCLDAMVSAMGWGHTEPATVDAILLWAKSAFLAREFSVAEQLYRAVLVPACTAEFDMGQDECIEEVLGVDEGRSIVEAAVCVYWNAEPKDRARNILEFFEELGESSVPWAPLKWLEEVAPEPLPEFDAFVREWSARVEQRVTQLKEIGGCSTVESWSEEARTRMRSS